MNYNRKIFKLVLVTRMDIQDAVELLVPLRHYSSLKSVEFFLSCHEEHRIVSFT